MLGFEPSRKEPLTLDNYSLQQLRSKIENAIYENEYKIVIDMDGVEYIDSLGIGDLVKWHVFCEGKGGILRLANVAGHLATIIENTTFFMSSPLTMGVNQAVEEIKKF